MLGGEGLELPATDDLKALVARVERFAAGARHPRDPRMIGGNLVLLRHSIDVLELQFAEHAAAFAATDHYLWSGSTTPIDWIRHHCQMTGTAVADRITVGEHMAAIPTTAQAVLSGDVGYAHLSLISHTHEAICQPEVPKLLLEEQLLGRAMDMSVGAFRFYCQHARHAADPAGPQAEQVEAVEQRKLRFHNWDRSVVSISGQLDAAGAAALKTALLPLARKQGRHDYRHRDRRMMDALLELADSRLSRPSLQVTTSIETLIGLAGAPAGEMELSPPICASTVQRLACDCGLTRVLLDSESMVIDVGRAKRVISGPLRKALHVRDKHCQWPGCERPATFSEGHHLIHWSKGGKTDLANLVLLCYRHHWLVHEGGWQLVKAEDGRLLTVKPLHRLFERRARGPDARAA